MSGRPWTLLPLPHLSGHVFASPRALAGGMMPALRLKITGLALVLVTAVGLGAGSSPRRAPEFQIPAASAPAAPAAEARNGPRLDRHDDPLPPGAITRLGTLRFRHHSLFDLAFTPDGRPGNGNRSANSSGRVTSAKRLSAAPVGGWCTKTTGRGGWRCGAWMA